MRRFSRAVLKSETISHTVCIASFKTVGELPRERFRQSRALASLRLAPINDKSPKKWSGQHRTSQTGSHAYAPIYRRAVKVGQNFFMTYKYVIEICGHHVNTAVRIANPVPLLACWKARLSLIPATEVRQDRPHRRCVYVSMP